MFSRKILESPQFQQYKKWLRKQPPRPTNPGKPPGRENWERWLKLNPSARKSLGLGPRRRPPLAAFAAMRPAGYRVALANHELLHLKRSQLPKDCQSVPRRLVELVPKDCQSVLRRLVDEALEPRLADQDAVHKSRSNNDLDRISDKCQIKEIINTITHNKR